MRSLAPYAIAFVTSLVSLGSTSHAQEGCRDIVQGRFEFFGLAVVGSLEGEQREAFCDGIKALADTVSSLEETTVRLQNELDDVEAKLRPIREGIIAFPEGCPDGWRQVPGSADRFLVGAGNNLAPGSTGGSSTITLTANDIPGHTHGVGNAWGIVVPGQGSNVFISPYSFSIPPTIARDDIKTQANNAPNTQIDNTPPYIALTLCTPR